MISVFLFILGLSSCSSLDDVNNSATLRNNYIVILDLSDRIIQRQDQIDIDTTAIRAVFEKFEKSVQGNLIVKSADRFSIRIIPQKNSTLPASVYENSLSIDMGNLSPTEKLIKLEAFRINFSTQLRNLYQQAYLGNKTSDFAGVDIWQYFNEQINSDLDSRYNNQVFVITDGYFDFEDNSHGISEKEYSTTSAPLLKKFQMVDWRVYADKSNVGILPVKIKINASWQICCIQPKSQSRDLLEADKLVYLWTKWLKASGASNIKEPIINTSSRKIKSLL
jgi:hypothetical protein